MTVLPTASLRQARLRLLAKYFSQSRICFSFFEHRGMALTCRKISQTFCALASFNVIFAVAISLLRETIDLSDDVQLKSAIIANTMEQTIARQDRFINVLFSTLDLQFSTAKGEQSGKLRWALSQFARSKLRRLGLRSISFGKLSFANSPWYFLAAAS